MVTAEIGVSTKFTGGECIVVTTEFRHKDQIKQVPGARYDVSLPRWVVPLSWTACVALRGVFGAELEVGPALNAWAAEDMRTRIEPALRTRQLMELPDEDQSLSAQIIRSWRTTEGLSLYPYQEAGVKFLATAGRCMLNDEMGTGKTAQTIRAVKLLHELSERGLVASPFPLLIVCPNSMKRVWMKEFSLWWPELEPVIVTGSPTQRARIIADLGNQVIIMNWEQVRLHSRLAPFGSTRLKRCHVCDSTLSAEDKNNAQSKCEWCPRDLNKRAWATVACDESHRMKDARAKQTRAVWACVTDATHYVYTLTGTPIASNPVDLWPSLRVIDQASWPAKTAFIDRYCLSQPNIFGGITILGLNPATRDEFFKAVDPRMRRMPKEAVLPFLPRKTYEERFVEMNPKQKRAYEQMEKTLVAQLADGGIVVATNPLTQLTRLVQFASAYAEIDAEGKVTLDDPSCKVDELMRLLDDLDGEPLVVFAMSRQLIELASRRLTAAKIDHGLITGAVTGFDRQLAIENFQGGKTRVIMGTVAAGGVGITLTRSPNLCFLQRSWSMIDNNQAEDRVHRIGSEQHDKITIFDIIAEDTLESRMRLMLGQKYERLEEYVRDREFLSRALGK